VPQFQHYNVTRKNIYKTGFSINYLNFQYILLTALLGLMCFINAISPAKEALIVTTSELPAMRMLTAWPVYWQMVYFK
jgi:septum formation inhibitor-activating ATPase MinD